MPWTSEGPQPRRADAALGVTPHRRLTLRPALQSMPPFWTFPLGKRALDDGVTRVRDCRLALVGRRLSLVARKDTASAHDPALPRPDRQAGQGHQHHSDPGGQAMPALASGGAVRMSGAVCIDTCSGRVTVKVMHRRVARDRSGCAQTHLASVLLVSVGVRPLLPYPG